ncbi:MAG: class I SAM-dependent methyltransferase [Candidatus Hodarchaeota archaeon]
MTDKKFYTDFQYTCREDKPRYVWEKYRAILKGKILDVGADECGLRWFLPEGTDYMGIGLGGAVERRIDLEKEKIPYRENTFACVLCLDVLEHLDNIHEVFDELCRVTSRYLIISLPNPWADFMGMLRDGYYKHTEFPMKFYNLPTTPPRERHKWFYGIHEAERFLEERGQLNGMKIIHMEREVRGNWLKIKIFELIGRFLFHKDVEVGSLIAGSVWAVLKKCI